MKGAHYKAVNVWKSKDYFGREKTTVGDITYYFDENGQEMGYDSPIGNSTNTDTKGRKWGWQCIKNLRIIDISPNRNRCYVMPNEFFKLHSTNQAA